jgi:hypothetical protein
MTQGAVLIAQNNKEVDYVKQAAFLAARIKKYLDLPTSLITDNIDYIHKNNLTDYFDKVIAPTDKHGHTVKKYRDGLTYQSALEFKNTDRSSVYDLTPYEETLLLDTDLIISDDTFKNCFTQHSDLMMYSDAFELSSWRDMHEFRFITDAGPKFYWATAVFFRKTADNKIFFNLIKHIQEHWVHYKKIYQIVSPVFRNDFAFSIAAHIMNGYTTNDFVKEMPGTLYFTTDRDELVSLKEDDFLFLIEKENQHEQFLTRIKGKTVHVMNKYSLGRIINDH